MRNVKLFCLVLCAFALSACHCNVETAQSHWSGGKVAFLGDSITDKIGVGTKRNYWSYLAEDMGFEPLVYGINGQTYKHIPAQAKKLKSEHPTDVDAIIVFCGTNDYISGAGLPLGDWYKYSEERTLASGEIMELRKHRVHNMDSNTFRGRINVAMSYLKENFPQSQIILLTPIHRSYAKFSKNNIQPDESFSNRGGRFIDDYIEAIKEAANVWAVSVIDLNAICGLYPNSKAYYDCFANAETDRLHPNAKGHYRMAKALRHALNAYPLNFK